MATARQSQPDQSVNVSVRRPDRCRTGVFSPTALPQAPFMRQSPGLAQLLSHHLAVGVAQAAAVDIAVLNLA
jgi:hypothetical protein